MFMVVIGTFAWNSIKLLSVVPRSDALVIVLVTVVSCYHSPLTVFSLVLSCHQLYSGGGAGLRKHGFFVSPDYPNAALET